MSDSITSRVVTEWLGELMAKICAHFHPSPAASNAEVFERLGEEWKMIQTGERAARRYIQALETGKMGKEPGVETCVWSANIC